MHNCQSIVTYNLHLCMYLFLYLFIYLFIHSFMSVFIYFCIYLFIYLFIHSCISSSQYVNEMCQSKIGRRYLTHHWLIVFNALYSIRLALPCCHGKRAIARDLARLADLVENENVYPIIPQQPLLREEGPTTLRSEQHGETVCLRDLQI